MIRDGEDGRIFPGRMLYFFGQQPLSSIVSLDFPVGRTWSVLTVPSLHRAHDDDEGQSQGFSLLNQCRLEKKQDVRLMPAILAAP